MGYYNPIWRYGPERFLDDARAAGVDGLIVVDLPPEEDDELCVPARGRGLHFIRLVTPTTDDRRLPKVLGNASGFLYYVSITGITGTKAPVAEQVGAAVARLRRHSALPVAVGFGIRTPAQAAAIARGRRRRGDRLGAGRPHRRRARLERPRAARPRREPVRPGRRARRGRAHARNGTP